MQLNLTDLLLSGMSKSYDLLWNSIIYFKRYERIILKKITNKLILKIKMC